MPASRRRTAYAFAAIGVAALVGGCATRPLPPAVRQPAPPPEVELQRVPDAEPRVEALRTGGPNKPYTISGRWYTPLAGDVPHAETGLASWYGAPFHGRATASGETYDMYAMTAAHKTLPIPSYARVRNPANGREVIVRVNDRGPFVDGRIVDLSYTAALRLGLLGGVAKVRIERITHDEIRAGTWRRGAVPQPLESPTAADPLGALLERRGLLGVRPAAPRLERDDLSDPGP